MTVTFRRYAVSRFLTVTNSADTVTDILTVSRPSTGTDHQFGTFMSEKLPNTSLKFAASVAQVKYS